MRSTNENEETGIWLALSIAWMIGSLAAWGAVAWGAPRLPASGSTLVLLALLVGGISIALRLPVLNATPVTTASSDQIVWLLACAANINWLGVLFLRSASMIDAVPAVLLIAAGESWVHQRVAATGGLPWLRALIAGAGRTFARSFTAVATNPPPLAHHTMDATPEPQAVLPADVARRSVDATDESGQRYLSGEIRVVLEAQQTSDSIVVAFCPAFAGTPAVELECEVLQEEALDEVGSDFDDEPTEEDELIARVVACTPAGMRVAVRRGRAACQRSYGLQWYATLAAETPPETMAARPLP